MIFSNFAHRKQKGWLLVGGWVGRWGAEEGRVRCWWAKGSPVMALKRERAHSSGDGDYPSGLLWR